RPNSVLARQRVKRRMVRSVLSKPDKLVGWWLLVVAAAVALMILIGGATRLTDSGLSITEWRPISGAIPPLSQRDWEHLFGLYRQTTEYQVQNRGMSLAEFQSIYWWEWGHRFLGRAIGLLFAIPFAIFWATGRLEGRFWQTLGLFALGGLQGAIGWWMVASGLAGRLDVSPLRLAVHLGLAIIILGYAVALAAKALDWPKQPSALNGPGWLVPVFLGALFLQILLGAFVAGTDAGKAYSDWPTIGGDLFPRSYAQLSPFVVNLVENHATTQFNHRLMGYAVALFALHIAGVGFRRGEGRARNLAFTVGALALLQAILGVVTILNAAPLDLSLAHQAGAVLLWVTGIALWRAEVK
ncbi:MAG: COX15/CtaA family protein, partial [Caulobacterales bacterium]